MIFIVCACSLSMNDSDRCSSLNILLFIVFQLIVLMFRTSVEYSKVPEKDTEGSPTMDQVVKNTQEDVSWLSVWWQQFVDALMVI